MVSFRGKPLTSEIKKLTVSVKQYFDRNKLKPTEPSVKHTADALGIGVELQPIETCWGVVKNHVARNCDFTVKNLIKQLDCGFNKVSAKTCKKIIKKVREIEDKFWATDIKMDAQ